MVRHRGNQICAADIDGLLDIEPEEDMTPEVIEHDEAPVATTAIVRRADALAPDLAALVERVLLDPQADVSKLSALLDVNERILDRAAKSAFDEAFSRMWPELPEIDEKGVIKQKDGSIKSRYARYEDIQSAVRPILKQFGFALRHRTEFPADRPGIIRIVGILSGHGHSEESLFEAPPDKNDYRTAIQDQGSTISYGKRYTTEDLLNIITRGRDNDGRSQGKPEAPDGYDRWFQGLELMAKDGLKAVEDAFGKSNAEYKNYAVGADKDRYNELKASARAVKRG